MTAIYNPTYILEMDVKNREMVASILMGLHGGMSEDNIIAFLESKFNTPHEYAQTLLSDVKAGVYDKEYI